MFVRGVVMMAAKNVKKLPVKAAGALGVAATVLSQAKPVLDVACNYADKALEERKKLVAVPELYAKDYPLTLEQAVELLDSCGLKAIPVRAPLMDANVRFRHCFDGQVIKSRPRARCKVERGSRVLVKYITQEVVDESIRLYEVSVAQKQQRKWLDRE